MSILDLESRVRVLTIDVHSLRQQADHAWPKQDELSKKRERLAALIGELEEEIVPTPDAATATATDRSAA